MNNSGIYKITNTINGKIYIGQSTDLTNRLYNHNYQLKNNKHKNKHLQASYNKYGPTAFTFEPIIYCDGSLLNEYETDLIYLSDASNPAVGYNKTLGGEGGKPNEETRLKISIAASKQFRNPFSEKTKLLMSEIAKQRDIISDETRLKMSIAAKNRYIKAS